MCLSKYSNLEHLREVAMNLSPSKEHDDLIRLCERELAALINNFYQVKAVFYFFLLVKYITYNYTIHYEFIL